MRKAMIVVFVMAIGWSAYTQTDTTKEAFKRIDGTWIPVSGELGGQPFPGEVLKKIKLILKDGQYTAQVGDVADEGSLKLDATRKPPTMDILGTKGPNKDKTILAIYERVDDTLRICYDLGGKKRPTTFQSEKGTQQFFVVYKRQ